MGTVCGAGDELTGLSRDGRGGGFDFYLDADADSAAVVPGADDERSGYRLGYLRFTPGAEFHVCHGIAAEVDVVPTRGGGGRGRYIHVDGDLPLALSSRGCANVGGPFDLCQDANVDPSAAALALASGPSAATTRASALASAPSAAAPALASLRSARDLTDFNRDRGSGISSAQARSFQELPDTNILHVNIQGLRSHMAELCAVIRVETAAPDIVCVNETFLDDGVEEVQLEGYIVVGRRDRSYSGDKRRCGGIIVFARTEIAEHVTLMSISDSSERMWILMHTLLGPYLLCVWYRPPSDGEVQSISDFETEYNQLKNGAWLGPYWRPQPALPEMAEVFIQEHCGGGEDEGAMFGL